MPVGLLDAWATVIWTAANIHGPLMNENDFSDPFIYYLAPSSGKTWIW